MGDLLPIVLPIETSLLFMVLPLGVFLLKPLPMKSLFGVNLITFKQRLKPHYVNLSRCLFIIQYHFHFM